MMMESLCELFLGLQRRFELVWGLLTSHQYIFVWILSNKILSLLYCCTTFPLSFYTPNFGIGAFLRVTRPKDLSALSLETNIGQNVPFNYSQICASLKGEQKVKVLNRYGAFLRVTLGGLCWFGYNLDFTPVKCNLEQYIVYRPLLLCYQQLLKCCYKGLGATFRVT